jgi:hypothetical protein
MAQIAKTEADMAASSAKDAGDKVTELGKQTTAAAAEITRDAASQAEAFARKGLQSVRPTVDAAAEVGQNTARRAQEGMAEINQSLLALLNEQARHNVHVLQTLAQPANWGKAVQLQSEFLSASLQRAAQFAWRYVEVGQAVMSSAQTTARGQTRQA